MVWEERTPSPQPGSQDVKNPESDQDQEQDPPSGPHAGLPRMERTGHDQETESPCGVQGLKACKQNLGEFSPARERESLRLRGGRAGAPMKGSSIRACQVRTKNSCSRLSFLSKRASERRRAPDLAAAFEPAFFSINSNPSLLEGIRSVIHLVLAGSPCHLGYGGFLEPWNRSSQGSGPTRRWRVQKNLSSVLGPFSFYRTVVPGRQALSLTFHWLPIRSNGLKIASPSALLLGLV